MNARAGTGSVTKWGVTNDGQPWLRVLGQDETTGHWAIFTVHVTWGDWVSIDHGIEQGREEVAQAEIPYE